MKSISGVILLLAAVGMGYHALDASSYVAEGAVAALASDEVRRGMIQMAELRFQWLCGGAVVCALFGGVLLLS